jgi:hypothetical protein
MKIKIIDNTFVHCNYSNNPNPPLQYCKWIEWDRDLSNLREDEILFFTDSNVFHPMVNLHKGKKIAWLLECKYLQPQVYQWVKENYQRFDSVVCCDIEFIKSISNGIWIPFGGCWVDKSDWKVYEKTKLISIVASEKRFLTGHQMRHKIIDEFRGKIDLFGRGYSPIQNKIDSLKDYKYQIVIENESISGYFTEKLIDCFMTGTIPIYYGDSSIESIFDMSGVMVVNGFEAIRDSVTNIESIDYSKFDKGKLTNFEIAKDYILSEDWIYNETKLI